MTTALPTVSIVQRDEKTRQYTLTRQEEKTMGEMDWSRRIPLGLRSTDKTIVGFGAWSFPCAAGRSRPVSSSDLLGQLTSPGGAD